MRLLCEPNKCLKSLNLARVFVMCSDAICAILQFWAEKAEKVFPNHDVVFHLKVRN